MVTGNILVSNIYVLFDPSTTSTTHSFKHPLFLLENMICYMSQKKLSCVETAVGMVFKMNQTRQFETFQAVPVANQDVSDT